MLNIKLPKTRYNTTTYPNLEERADGMLIPIVYGDLHGVVPVCIDTVAKTYKLADHAIHSIDSIKTETETLSVSSDYSVDLADAEFSFLSTPYLAANTTYYFVVETDYGVSGSNHIHLKQFGNVYVGGGAFSIDGTGAGVWTADTGHDIRFKIFGKATLADQEVVKINNDKYHTMSNLGLKDNAARTRLAQSFTTGSSAFYFTRILLSMNKTGSPSGNIRISILSAYTPSEVQVGVKSFNTVIDIGGGWAKRSVYFPLHSDASSLTCDIEGAEKTGATIVDGADMLEDLVVNRIGKLSTILNAAALSDFKTKRTQAVAAYIDTDMTFGEIVGKLESSLLFKFVPLHDGTYAPTVYAAGDPLSGPPPHFFDEHFLSFSMRRDFAAVKNLVKIKYDENPGNDEFKVKEADSDIAKFVYGTEETLEVETYLKSGTNAATLATDYLGMYEIPPLEITFEIRGYGLNLNPGRDKVKITRTRAAYAGGKMSGVLFRIVKLTKKPATASTEIVAVLDTQTY